MHTGKSSPPPPSAEAAETRRTFRLEGKPVLEILVRRPRFTPERGGAKGVNRFYERLAGRFLTRWEQVLYPRACAAARAAGGPFTPWRAELTFEVSLLNEAYLSVVQTVREETGGNRPAVRRRADTWALPSFSPCPLRPLLPKGFRIRIRLLACLRRLARERLAGGETLYFPDWPRRLARCFDAENFFLTPQGVTLFYPPDTVGPPAEGFVCFSLPGEAEEESPRKK